MGFSSSNLLHSSFNGTAGPEKCRYFESKHHEDLDTNSYHFYRLIAFKLIFIIVYQVMKNKFSIKFSRLKVHI
jgi:hypothetical protein